MIDLTNAPEGATHRCGRNFYKVSGGKVLIYLCETWSETLLSHDSILLEGLGVTPLWSICNNAKPLSELSDIHAAELTNYWRRGEPMERNDKTIGWRFAVETTLSRYETYRAKQKTELELFIDAAKATGGGLSPAELELVHAMFNVGFKAPNVGE